MHLLSPALCSVHVASIKVENVKNILLTEYFYYFHGKTSHQHHFDKC